MKFSVCILLSVISCVYSQAILEMESPSVNFVQNQNNYAAGFENELNLVFSNYIWTVTQVMPDITTGTIARVNVDVNPATNVDPNSADEEFIARRGTSIGPSFRLINQVSVIRILAQDAGTVNAPPQQNQNPPANNQNAATTAPADDDEDAFIGLTVTEIVIIAVVVFFGLLTMMILAIILIRRAKRNNNRRTGNRGIEARMGGEEADNRLQTTWQAGAEVQLASSNNLLNNNLGGSGRGIPVQQRQPISPPQKTYAAPTQPSKTYAAPLQSNKTTDLTPEAQEAFRREHPQFKNTLANFGQ